jgi:tetratricopeptide (TPR) repeat protein
MTDGAHHRQQARTFEQRENWKRAIEAYEAALQADREARKEPDLALLNRVGDLYHRIGDVNRAVDCYEKAADGHLAAGFYNNAIALCNKILRNQPNRHSAYLKLGKIAAAKGLLPDARRHFLEYAERMQKSKKLEEAFGRLIDVASQTPEPQVRLMIAEQLIEHRWKDQAAQQLRWKDEAVDQLRLAWRDLTQEGRTAEAQEVRDRILKLAPKRDPEKEPVAESSAAADVDAMGVLDLPEILPYDEPEERQGVVEEEVAAEEVVEEEIVEEVEEEKASPVVDDLESAFEGEELGKADVSLEVEDLELTGLAAEESGEEPGEEEYEGIELEPVDLDSIAADLAGMDSYEATGEELGIVTDSFDEEASVEAVAPPAEEDLGIVPTSLAPEEPEVVERPRPRPRRPAPRTPAERVADIEARLETEGRDPGLLVALAEALLETGGREKATFCLGEAVELHEQRQEYQEAGWVLDELLRLNVNDVRAYQKRVELAFRAGDRTALILAYLGLADCLDRTDAGNKARAVYARVLELDPRNVRALAALEMLGAEDEAEAQAAAQETAAQGDYVELATLVRIPADDPRSEADVDFAAMLEQFKSKVAEALEEEDATSHYDLGVAYKEMGLIDEAIAEFQIAARGMDFRLRAIEMLGACFLEKHDYRIALKVLGRAIQVPGYAEDDLVGIYYAMGRAFEALGEHTRAVEWYERVLGCDLNFKDASQRLHRLRQQHHL